ncbi:hypothetical protein [Candidatus Vidania fulgoroideorum]
MSIGKRLVFCVKKVPVSLRKLKISSRFVRHIGITNFLRLCNSNLNKPLRYIFKLLHSSFSYINSSGFIVTGFELFCNKCFSFKRYNERAKGKMDFIRRRYSNIYFFAYI